MSKRGHIPYRSCIGCRQKRRKTELIRLVRTSERTVQLDEAGKGEGRGAYLCPNKDCFRLAKKRVKGFELRISPVDFLKVISHKRRVLLEEVGT